MGHGRHDEAPRKFQFVAHIVAEQRQFAALLFIAHALARGRAAEAIHRPHFELAECAFANAEGFGATGPQVVQRGHCRHAAVMGEFHYVACQANPVMHMNDVGADVAHQPVEQRLDFRGQRFFPVVEEQAGAVQAVYWQAFVSAVDHIGIRGHRAGALLRAAQDVHFVPLSDQLTREAQHMAFGPAVAFRQEAVHDFQDFHARPFGLRSYLRKPLVRGARRRQSER